jgi:hypothetical protein
VEKALHLAANFCIVSGWMNNQADGLALCNSAIERAKSLLPVDGNANIHP